LSPLIERITNEPKIMHIRVTREDDGAGVCAGASLGGKRAVLVCQNAGLLLSANALAGYAHHHQLPFLVLAVYRGSYEDRFYYQMYKGLVTEPVLDALRIPFHVVDRIEDVAIVEEAAREASLARRPVVVLLRRAALLGDAEASCCAAPSRPGPASRTTRRKRQGCSRRCSSSRSVGSWRSTSTPRSRRIRRVRGRPRRPRTARSFNGGCRMSAEKKGSLTLLRGGHLFDLDR